MSNLRKINPINTELTTSEANQSSKIDLLTLKFRNLIETHELINEEEELQELEQVLDTQINNLETLREKKKAKKIREQRSSIQAQKVQRKKQLSELDRIFSDNF